MVRSTETLSSIELDQALEGETLREIERALDGKLTAFQLSRSFIDRNSEEAIQRGLVEYLRARKRGVEVKDPGAFVVEAAFRRAIDELRREAREADGVEIDALLENERFAAPATEEIALDQLSAAELRAAIQTLPAEERQILCLHYFEELSDRQAAEIVFCSERTFRRRLAKALRHVGRRLGASVPEPGSGLAIEIGLCAWVSLRGAQVAISSGPLEQLAGLLDGARDGARWFFDRGREVTGQLNAGGASEKVGAIASGPGGKVAGACAGAAVVCLLGGALGAGTSLLGGQEHSRHAVIERTARSHQPAGRPARPQSQAELAPTRSTAALGTTAAPASRAKHKRAAQQAERHQVKAQTSGIARAANESSPSSSTSAAGSATAETATAAPATAEPSPSEAASEEEQAKEQFGAFK
jgi:RNA polymerase sigma factor (sigma-70 family)